MTHAEKKLAESLRLLESAHFLLNGRPTELELGAGWAKLRDAADLVEKLAKEAVASFRAARGEPVEAPISDERLERGVDWIAFNDDPEELDVERIAGTVSVGLLADLAGVPALDVARCVFLVRDEERKVRAASQRAEGGRA